MFTLVLISEGSVHGSLSPCVWAEEYPSNRIMSKQKMFISLRDGRKGRRQKEKERERGEGEREKRKRRGERQLEDHLFNVHVFGNGGANTSHWNHSSPNFLKIISTGEALLEFGKCALFSFLLSQLRSQSWKLVYLWYRVPRICLLRHSSTLLRGVPTMCLWVIMESFIGIYRCYRQAFWLLHWLRENTHIDFYFSITYSIQWLK